LEGKVIAIVSDCRLIADIYKTAKVWVVYLQSFTVNL